MIVPGWTAASVAKVLLSWTCTRVLPFHRPHAEANPGSVPSFLLQPGPNQANLYSHGRSTFMTLTDPVSSILKAKGNKDNIWSVSPDISVYEAMRVMAEKDIGALMVMTGARL